MTIAISDKENDKQGSWSSDNGSMVTAPATNRTEAIGISNEIMSKYLNGIYLE